MSSEDGVTSSVQSLRMILIGVSVAVLAAFLIPRKVTVSTAYAFLALFAGWIGYIIFEINAI